jgi:hypothetical protein
MVSISLEMVMKIWQTPYTIQLRPRTKLLLLILAQETGGGAPSSGVVSSAQTGLHDRNSVRRGTPPTSGPGHSSTRATTRGGGRTSSTQLHLDRLRRNHSCCGIYWFVQHCPVLIISSCRLRIPIIVCCVFFWVLFCFKITSYSFHTIFPQKSGN